MTFFSPQHPEISSSFCHRLLSKHDFASEVGVSQQYLIGYLEKLFDVSGLFINFLGMWQPIICHGTNCPARQGVFRLFLSFQRANITGGKSEVFFSA